MLDRLKHKLLPFRYFVRAHPVGAVMAVVGLVAAGFAEALGVVTLLPLVYVLLESGTRRRTPLSEYVEEAYRLIGFEPSLGVLLVAIVVFAVAQGLIGFLAMRHMGYLTAGVTDELRVKLMRGLMEARWSYFVRQRLGYLATALVSEPRRIASLFGSGCRMASQFVMVLVYLALALVISWQVTLATIVVGALSAVLLSHFVHIAKATGREFNLRKKEYMQRLLEGLTGIKPIKAMAQEDRVLPLLVADSARLLWLQKRKTLSQVTVAHFQEPIHVAALAGGMYVLYSIWNMPLGTIVVMAVLFGRTVRRIGMLQRTYQQMVHTEPAFHFMYEMLRDTDAAHESWPGVEVRPFRQAIVFRDVSFVRRRVPVLDRVDLTIPAGRFTAVVGPSGAGKTTLVDLMTGMLVPASGEITVDGRPLRQLDVASWRRQIGYVSQETFLFHNTIRVNVTLGDPDLSDAQVEQALRRAGAWDFVQERPKGLDAVVGERGGRLSGGQRQRIAIARALVHDPQLLILDEATASLDPVTEAEIVHTLGALAKHTTIVAVSHQAALTDAADIVYRIDQGRVSIERQPAAPLETSA